MPAGIRSTDVVIPLGREVRTGQRIAPKARNLLGEGLLIQSPARTGKSTILRAAISTASQCGAPAVVFDYSATLHRELEAWTAQRLSFLLLAAQEFPEQAEAQHWVERFLKRHAFMHLGAGRDNTVVIDTLRRRWLAGREETVEEAVIRNILPFEWTFEGDFDPRTQFLNVVVPLLTILIAAGRSICEFDLLLDGRDERFLRFCLAEIDERFAGKEGTQDTRYVRERIKDFYAIRAKITHQPKGGIGTKAYDEYVQSTRHALGPYKPETLLGRLFGGEETFSPERVVFGDALCLVTTDVPDDIMRKRAMRHAYAIFQSCARARLHRTGEFRRLLIAIDEPWWIPSAIQDMLAIAGNLRTSFALAYQSAHQFEDIEGLKLFPKKLPSLLGCQMYGRSASPEEAKVISERRRRFSPDGMILSLVGRSIARTQSVADTLGSTWADTISRSHGINGSEGLSLESGGSSGFSTHPDYTSIVGQVSAGRKASSQRGWSEQEGEAHTNGGAASRTEGESVSRILAEHFFRVGRDEQIGFDSEEILHRPKFQYDVLRHGKSVAIKLYGPRHLSESILGVPVFELYRQAHDRTWSKPISPRKPFDLAVRIRSLAEPQPPATISPAIMVPATPPPPHAHAPAEQSDGDEKTPAPPRAPMSAADQPRLFALFAAAILRVPTIHDFLALGDRSYDTSYRILHTLAEGDPPALDVLRPAVGRGGGSAPAIYLLTSPGAAELARGTGHDAAALDRIVKNVGALRRDVEAGRPTQLVHRRRIASLLALLYGAAFQRDPGVTLHPIRWERELSIPLSRDELGSAAAPVWWRLQANPDRDTTTYVPDLYIRVRWADGTSWVVCVEVETGAGERDYEEIGFLKGLKLAALQHRFERTGRIDAETADPAQEFRALVWASTPAVEQQFFAGAKRAFAGTRDPLWLTHGEILPLAPPTKTSKKDLARVVAHLRATLFTPVWRWLRVADPNDRKRLFHARSTP